MKLCAWCGKPHGKGAGEVNRAAKVGANMYCNRKCAGLGRRKGKTKAQKVAEKSAYDREYRERKRELLKAKKREYFQRTYDPTEAAKYRKKRMPYHVEYCRQPEYKAYKQKYDQQRRDNQFGPFAEAARLAIELNREVKSRASNHEIYQQNNIGNKTQQRRREEARADRSRRHSETEG